jgi:hypothetical protein
LFHLNPCQTAVIFGVIQHYLLQQIRLASGILHALMVFELVINIGLVFLVIGAGFSVFVIKHGPGMSLFAN